MGARDAARRPRIGLIGLGYVGRAIYDRLSTRSDDDLDLAFVHNRGPAALRDIPPGLVLHDLADLPRRGADLVVEMAHPAYTRDWGGRILAGASYLPLSVTALADDALRERLLATATAAGTSLALPHGALMGLDSLHEWRHQWDEVVITFRKSPANIDFSESGTDPATVTAETVLYDGPARGIAALYPRNVNTMITCALATIGLDRCRARLVAIPGLPVAVAEVTARGRDGARLHMLKEQPAVGVSGTEMVEALFASILRAAGARRPLDFV